MTHTPATPAPAVPTSIALAAVRSMREFLQQESAGGIVLMGAALLALVLANSPLAPGYFGALDTEVALTVGGAGIVKPALLWINDGLMALFFFLIGLEVKREVLEGQLSSWQQSSLPLFAAIGGMALPALVFLGVNMDSPANLNGWAIPAATDIAFALGVLALLGSRVPTALKALLLAIAVIDDIGAIAIIALFYTPGVQTTMLAMAAAILVVLALIGRARVSTSIPYIVLGAALWFFVLKSGVHATLAGVALAMTVPLYDRTGDPVLERMEHALHPWVAFMVVPIFALANAVKTGVSSLPEGISWRHVWGLSLVAGIGFTMSLFIGNLAFADPALIDQVKLGVLSGSLVAALAGVAILMGAREKTAQAA